MDFLMEENIDKKDLGLFNFNKTNEINQITRFTCSETQKPVSFVITIRNRQCLKKNQYETKIIEKNKLEKVL